MYVPIIIHAWVCVCVHAHARVHLCLRKDCSVKLLINIKYSYPYNL